MQFFRKEKSANKNFKTRKKNKCALGCNSRECTTLARREKEKGKAVKNNVNPVCRKHLHFFLPPPNFPSFFLFLFFLLAPAGLFELLNKISRELETMQRALEQYLETKRHVFPRFYFISNEDLLEILANARKPELIQVHIKKLFENIKFLTLSKVSSRVSFKGIKFLIVKLQEKKKKESTIKN